MSPSRNKCWASVIGCLLAFSIMATAQQSAVAADGVSVSGAVKFDGPIPKRQPISLREKGGKLSDCERLHKTVLLKEDLLVSKKGQIANAFVYVKRGVEKKSYPAPKKPAVLNQDKCMFRPRVQGILIGQEFLMRNSDPLSHNVRSFAFKNRAFNIGQPAGSEDRKKVFTRSERAVKVQCDIHPWMTAYYFVMEHPYFAVTGEKGQFKIEGLPPGEYTLSAWHEELGKQDLKITVSATGSSETVFTFKDKGKSR